MGEFFSQRLSRHFKKMSKYLRYILNDHFVLVCMFLLGGLGLYYSQLLKELPRDFVWGRPLILLGWLLLIQVGKLTTLTEEPDKVFLLPKEKQFAAYLKRALRYSLLLPIVVSFLGSGLLMPLIVVTTGWSFQTFFLFLVMLVCMIYTHLSLQNYGLYHLSSTTYRSWWFVWLISSLLIMTGAIYWTPWVGVIGGIILAVCLSSIWQNKMKQSFLDWEKMIQKEQNRMHRIYKFIQLFTDIPEVSSTVKRRKYLDPLLGVVKKTSENTYAYLFIRSFLRGSEYSGLLFRLILVGGVLLFFLQEFWIALVVALLFVYLIGFQLIPMYTQFDYMVMTQLYPISIEKKQAAIRRLISGALSVASIIFGGIVCLRLGSLQNSLIILGALIVEVVIFTKMYVPMRLNKL
ncbi:ABC transporter permease [Enterococcus faecalis]|uniref:ABC transporter permease n=1 Tax=Enterococcus faecalis TaxID=1351 RepID=UPI003A978384